MVAARCARVGAPCLMSLYPSCAPTHPQLRGCETISMETAIHVRLAQHFRVCHCAAQLGVGFHQLADLHGGRNSGHNHFIECMKTVRSAGRHRACTSAGSGHASVPCGRAQHVRGRCRRVGGGVCVGVSTTCGFCIIISRTVSGFDIMDCTCSVVTGTEARVAHRSCVRVFGAPQSSTRRAVRQDAHQRAISLPDQARKKLGKGGDRQVAHTMGLFIICRMSSGSCCNCSSIARTSKPAQRSRDQLQRTKGKRPSARAVCVQAGTLVATESRPRLPGTPSGGASTRTMSRRRTQRLAHLLLHLLHALVHSWHRSQPTKPPEARHPP